MGRSHTSVPDILSKQLDLFIFPHFPTGLSPINANAEEMEVLQMIHGALRGLYYVHHGDGKILLFFCIVVLDWE